jgi:uncharacterized membrane protein YbhN (UPF0104 family)
MVPVLHRSALRIALALALAAGGAAVFVVVAHPGRLAGSLGALPLGAAASAVGATMAGVMLVAVRWRSLLGARSIEAPTAKLFAALTIGSAVNNIVPARAGDAVRVESAHRFTGAPRLSIAGSLVAERVLDGIAVAAALVVAVAVAAARVSALAVLRVPRVLVPTLATSVAIWFADVVMYGALAHGFHLDLSFGTLLLLVGAGNLALAIPGTAAGIGSFELVTLAGAHGIGIGGPALTAFVLAVHAVIVLPTTLTGLALAGLRPMSFAFGRGQ